MKKLILVLFSQIIFFSSKAQQLDWIKDVACFYSNHATGLAFDSSGNVYLSVDGSGPSNFAPAGNLIIKYNPSGNILWADTIKTNSGTENAGIVSDSNGNAYTWGSSLTNGFTAGNNTYTGGAFFVKYSPTGQILWAKSVNGQPWDIAIDSFGYVYGREVDGVHKYDSSGNIVMNINDGLRDIAIDGSSNIYIYLSNPSVIKKYSSSGSLLWTYPTEFVKLTVDPLGNCYYSNPGSSGISNITKINPSGFLVWSYTVSNWGGSIYADNIGYIYSVGACGNSPPAGLKINKHDSNGNLLWAYQLPNPTLPQFLYTPTNIMAKDNSVYISGYKSSSMPVGFLLKLNEPNIPTSLKKNQVEGNLSISPNPSCCIFSLSYKNKESGSINVTVYDALGKVIFTKNVKNFSGEVNETIDLTGFAKGVYILELIDGKLKEARKLVVE